MNSTKLSFESENLVVDWIGFNIQGSVDIKPIANYLFQTFGFNSIIAKRINGKWKSQDLKYDSRNQFQMSFRQHEYDPEYKSFWVGTQINFSGENAAYLYRFIKEHQFNWNIFELQRTSLARLDLHYFRQSKATDSKQQVQDFMQASCDSIRAKSKRRQVQFDPNKKPYMIKIGNRLSCNYYRVYQKAKRINYDVYSEVNHGLEFELELKNKLVKAFQQFLFDNQIEEFEDRLTQHFFKQSSQNFGLNFCYTDWLAKVSRKVVQKTKFKSGLVTDYLENIHFKSFAQKDYLFRFFQFLTFIRRFKGVKQYNGDQVYYLITFPVSDFLQFTSFTGVPRKRQYQLKKILSFLLSLQKLDPIVEIFSDASFRSYVIFPYISVIKQGKSWVARISISEQLYFYKYPFFLPEEFLLYKDKYDMEVKLQFIQSFNVSSLEKKFDVEDFLNLCN